MVGMRKAASILLLCTMMSSLASSILSFPAHSDPFTSVDAEVNEDEQEVDVSPGSHGSVTFTGEVTADNINTATPLIVELWVETPVGTATIDKPSMVFQGSSQSNTFQIVVVLPLGESASDGHTCMVEGTWSQGGRSGEVDGDTFKIIIPPYYLPKLSCESPERNVTRGDDVTFTVLVNNTGNTDDTFRIEVEHREELKKRGIKVSDVSDMSLKEDAFKEFQLKVRTSRDSPAGKVSFDLVATSTIDEHPKSDRMILTVNIREGELSLFKIFNPLTAVIVAVVVIAGIVVYVKRR